MGNGSSSLCGNVSQDRDPEIIVALKTKNMFQSEGKLKEAGKAFGEKYQVSRKTHTLVSLQEQFREKIREARKKFFGIESELIWQKILTELKQRQKKVFSKEITIPFNITPLNKFSNNFNNFAYEILNTTAKENQWMSMLNQNKSAFSVDDLKIMIEKISNYYFLPEVNLNVIEQIFIQIKNKSNLDDKNIEIIVEFLSKLVWKKIQIDIFDYWMTKMYRNIKQKCRYQDTIPYFFKHFNLEQKDIDQRGFRQFPEQKKPKLSNRGTFQYFQPIYCRRYGINLKYFETPDTNNDWFGINDQKQVWPVAFYAISASQICRSDGTTLLQAIVSRNKNSPNFLQENINCSQYFTLSLSESKSFKVGLEQYKIILQCRVNPQKLQGVKGDEHWMIRSPKDIIPYGIIVFTKNQIEKIEQLSQHKDFYPSPNQYIEISIVRSVSQNTDLSSLRKIRIGMNYHDYSIIKSEIKARIDRNGSLQQGKSFKRLNNLHMQFNYKIDKQDIRDEGVKYLCSNQTLNNLKTIQLNDNKITVEGVSHLINNKFSDTVTYKLDTVKTLDNGYAFKVGQSIKTIKKIIDNSMTQINYTQISKLELTNKSELFQALDLMMKTPIQGKYESIVAQSRQIQEKYQKIHEENLKNQKPSKESLIMTLKETLGAGSQVLLSEKSSVRSQVTFNLALCGMGQDRVKFKHRIPDGQWKYQDLENNNAMLLKFEDWYKEHLAAEYGANKEDIVLHRINKGSVWACASVNHDNFLIRSSQFTATQKIEVIPFFEGLNLSPEDFHDKGNYTFAKNDQTELQWRAGIPYYQPVHATRFGINISTKYDGGKDDWLSMDGVPGEWAVAFHGINKPSNIIPSNNKTVLESIMSGRQSGNMLIVGPHQAYANSTAVNKSGGQLVGNGIYCSPYFTTCLSGYTQDCTVNNLKFRVVLQCRIKPEALKCTSRVDYWVINESKYIRPYGILLITSQQVTQIQSLRNAGGLYSMPCDYSAWKKQYQKFRQKHNLST